MVGTLRDAMFRLKGTRFLEWKFGGTVSKANEDNFG